MAIRSVGICLKPEQPQLADLVRRLQKWLVERGLTVVSDPEAARAGGGAGTPREEIAERADVMVVLGGDGTFLAVAREVGSRPVPILGVNLGTLGFLTEIAQDELFPTLEDAISGAMRVEPRMRLEVTVDRGGEELGRYLALNEAVIANTGMARLVDLETRADGVEVTTYHADGLIVATPTGSTAYSLSAGGPLLHPTLEVVVLTPICPHTLTERPLVLPETCEISVRVRDRRGCDITLSVDGQVGRELREGDRVMVRRSEYPLHLLVHPGRNRFQVLRTKLGWGAR
ncbi:MAG: NAD(+)/NADH kinase [Myxococcota bacterium]